MVPRTWRKPLTLIYDRNYKYGTGLYSGTITEIEKRYKLSMARTKKSFSADTLGTGVLNPAQVFPEPRTSSHLQPVLTSSDLGWSLADMDRWSLEPVRHRYRHLLADPFDLDEKSRARRRLRRRHADVPATPLHVPSTRLRVPASSRHIPWSSLHVPDFGTSSFTHSLFPYWGRRHHLPYLSDYPLLSGKCERLQSELEMFGHRVSDAQSKLRWDSVKAGSKGDQELRVVELESELHALGRDNSELYKVIKRQARQIEEMQSLQDELHRHLGHAHEDVASWQRKFNDLQFDLTSVRFSRTA